MCGLSCRVQLELFLCVAASAPTLLCHRMCVFLDHSLIDSTSCGSCFSPLLTLQPRYPPPTHTHTLSLSFPQCYFKPPHHSPPLDTTCLRSVPEEGLVFSITSVSLLDPHVAPVSLCGCWMFPTRPPRLLSPSTLEGCQHDSISLDFSETSSQP